MPKEPKTPKEPVQVPLAETAQWEQWRKEGAIERDQQLTKEREAELTAAYDDEGEPVNGTVRSQQLDAELEDSWSHLKRIAMTKFPEGAALLGLSAKNRLVAVAHCLGWKDAQIAKASRVSQTTIAKWLKRPDIVIFCDEFNLKQGDADIVKEKLPSLEYKAIQCIEEILSDKDKSVGMSRLKLDAADWVFNRSRGKPNQPIEHKDEGIRKLLEILSKSKPAPITPEEEATLFKSAKGNA
jgi:hypothetical protein